MFRTLMDSQPAEAPVAPQMAELIRGYSIEVMPRTAAKVEDFRHLLPAGTRVYIAHIDGTPIDDMVATAVRIAGEGFPVMPHLPARSIRDAGELELWLKRYRDEAGVDQALLLGGGSRSPAGMLTSSIEMIETGLFDRYGFQRLHVAGHPEGNRDIDLDGTTRLVDDALTWKQRYSKSTDAAMAITTQFAFDAETIIAWDRRLRAAGITMPVHIGVAGSAKLQTLLKYAIACGVGPSLKVLQKRAMDITKLMLPYEPTDVLSALADHVAQEDSLIEQVHFFPLGGISAAAEWANARTGETLPQSA
ncbi:methylenetetrahydrofolate reductase [Rhizobium halophytocola]|uniref:methylenetetrahydrofolate reductase n=1 Tax=Rhizobium halophytocola TaxID=735519 RepID=UPI0031591DE5